MALFHAIGLTPEAPTIEAACGGEPEHVVRYDAADLKAAALSLSTLEDGAPIDAVTLGARLLAGGIRAVDAAA